MEPTGESRAYFRSDQRHAREIGAIASAVARQQRQPAYRGVGADKNREGLRFVLRPPLRHRALIDCSDLIVAGGPSDKGILVDKRISVLFR